MTAFRVTGCLPRLVLARPRARPAVLFRAGGFAVTHPLPRSLSLPVSRSQRYEHEPPVWACPRPVAQQQQRLAVNTEPIRPTLRHETRWELYQLYKAAGLLHMFFALYPE